MSSVLAVILGAAINGVATMVVALFLWRAVNRPQLQQDERQSVMAAIQALSDDRLHDIERLRQRVLDLETENEICRKRDAQRVKELQELRNEIADLYSRLRKAERNAQS